MSTFHRMQVLAAVALLSATAAVSAAPVAPEVPVVPVTPAGAQGDCAPQAAAGPTVPKERLRVGLSDSGTKLVLPWFVTELTTAVNEGKSASDTAKALARGF